MAYKLADAILELPRDLAAGDVIILSPLARHARQSLTRDRGLEFVSWRELEPDSERRSLVLRSAGYLDKKLCYIRDARASPDAYNKSHK